MARQSILLLLFMAASLVACERKGNLEQRIVKLERFQSLSEIRLREIDTIPQMISLLEDQVVALEGSEEAEVDPTSRSYRQLRADGRIFFVASVDLSTYGDGQKVTLAIGNPYNCAFTDVDLAIRYGTRRPTVPIGVAALANHDSTGGGEPAKKYVHWLQGLKSKKYPSAVTLLPGRWNKVEIVIAPAKAEEIGFLGVKMSTGTIILN